MRQISIFGQYSNSLSKNGLQSAYLKQLKTVADYLIPLKLSHLVLPPARVIAGSIVLPISK